MSDDPIIYEDQRQARDHYRAVNKLIGEEDLAILKDAIELLCEHDDTIFDDRSETIIGLLRDITSPEGIGAWKEPDDE